jgi:hypothetical protein
MMKTTLIIAASMFLAAFATGQNPNEKVIQVTTSVTENSPAISFKWNQISENYNISIYRKNKNSNQWGNPIATLPPTAVEYTDKNVETGFEYEYSLIAKSYVPIATYVNAGIKCKATEYRGKIILLVDSTFVTGLKDELGRYESDLIGDGWEVLRKDIDRNASVKYVKSIIRDFYNSDPKNVNTVFLFGHIAVPYSGTKAYDGHAVEHDGAWPADLYYGDMYEKLWNDKYECCTTADRPENWNIPGDGKFDVCVLPLNEEISLSVGRVDLCNLPAFSQPEAELLRNYLNKNHAFRHKINDPKMQALIYDRFQTLKYASGITEAFSISGWRNFSALLNFSNIKTGDFFTGTKNDSYIWSYGCGGGTFTSAAGIGTTADFVAQSPKTVFTCLYGSWFGDWDTENNFMRAALASNGWILTCCWAGRPHYTFHQMGMGETIGNCVRATQNNINCYYYGAEQTKRGIHVGLQGDPTLRMHIVQPVNSLKSAVGKSNTVVLSWNQSDDDIVGYYIYKLNALTNKYIRISETPVTGTRFEDVSPDEGNNYYMVRTLKLSQVVSGSYYNLSQGIFDTIRVEKQSVPSLETTASTVNTVNETVIYPNPSTGLFNISFGSNPVHRATIKIYNLQGKLMNEETFQNATLERFDIGTLPKGIYIVSGVIDGKNMSTKISLL